MSALAYALVGWLIPNVAIADPLKQFALIVGGVSASALFLPELSSDLWSVDPDEARQLIPESRRSALMATLIEAESVDGEWNAHVTDGALEPLVRASHDPSLVLWDVDYQIKIDLDRDIHVGGRVIPSHRVESSLSADRSFPLNQIHRKRWVSVARTGQALEREFREPDCVLRELVPLGESTAPEAWVDEVLAHCKVKVYINAIEQYLTPETSLVEDVVRWSFTPSLGPDVGQPEDWLEATETAGDGVTPFARVKTLINFEYPIDGSTRTFPVKFSSYYCAGTSGVRFHVEPRRGRIEVDFDPYVGTALGGRVQLEPTFAGERNRYVLQTDSRTLLWPGTGVLFSWRRPMDHPWLEASTSVIDEAYRAMAEHAELEHEPLQPIRIVASGHQARAVKRHDIGENLVALATTDGLTVFRPYKKANVPEVPAQLLLRDSVAVRLASACKELPDGFGIAVLDGWRPRAFQAALVEEYSTAEVSSLSGYVWDPNDWTVVPPHTTGGAVDLTLTFRGVPLALGSPYDDFSPLAHLDAYENSETHSQVRDLRRLLASVLLLQEFAPYPLEWWHWSYGDQMWAAHYGKPESLYDVATAASQPELGV